MSFDNAHCLAEKIDQDLHANGSQTANKLLTDAFSSPRVDRQQLICELEKKGDLKELAVQFLIDPNVRRKYDTSGDGAINFAELNQGQENIKLKISCGKATAQEEYESAMLDVLKNKFDEIKSTHNDREGGFLGFKTHEKEAITYNDMSKVLRTADRTRQDDRVLEENRNAMNVLLRSDIPIFRILDASKTGSEDNRISKDDLDRYLKNYDQRTNFGKNEQAKCGEYSEEIHTAVKSLRANWDKDAVTRLRETVNVPTNQGQYATVPGDFITVASLAQAGGFGRETRIDALVEKYCDETAKAAAQKASKLACTALDTENTAREKESLAQDAARRQAEEQRKLADAQEQVDILERLHPRKGRTVDEPFPDKCGPSPDVTRILTASKGKGPWTVAEQLLGPEASALEVLTLARQIRDAYNEVHGKGSASRIRVNERWLTDEQWHKIAESNDKFKGKYAH